MKVREIVRLIEEGSWFVVATRGNRRWSEDPSKAGRVTVARKISHDLSPGTSSSILKQEGLKEHT